MSAGAARLLSIIIRDDRNAGLIEAKSRASMGAHNHKDHCIVGDIGRIHASGCCYQRYGG